MDSSASSLEKCRCQQREMSAQSENSMGSYRTRLHLNAFARATGEQSLFITAGEHRGVFVITGNAVLITQSFLFFFNINNPTSAMLSVRHCSPCSLPADVKLSAWMRAVKQRPLCIQHFSLSSFTADISYVAFVFHSHISSATLTTSSAEYSGHGECPVSRNRPVTKMVPRNRIYHYKE